MTDFDHYAAAYEDHVSQSIKLSGESVEYFAQMKAQYLVRLLGAGFSGKLLDYGCGVGLLSRFLAEHLPATTLHGFDLSADSISRVPASLVARGRFTSVRNDLDRDYNVIVVVNVLHHVPPPERPAVVAELALRLAPQGRLIVIEHNPLNPVTRWAVSHCEFDEGVVLLLPGETRRYAQAAGLRPVRRDYIGFFPRSLSALRPLEPYLQWCPAGAQYCLVAQK